MKRIASILIVLSLAGTIFISCTSPGESDEPVQTINLSYMDSTVRLQDDFF